MNFSWPSIRRQIALFSAMAGILSGCQTNEADSFMASSLADDVSVAAAESIANDLVAHLAQQVGPGTGTVLLRQDGSVFGKAFDTALKKRGYAVVTNQKWDAKERVIPIAYVVIPFEGQLLARLRSDKVELGRAYMITQSGAQPANPLSIMRQG